LVRLPDGWVFTFLDGGGTTGFNIATVHSAGTAAIAAIIIPALYHAFLRRCIL
jgi:hypothetical protein